MAQRAKEKDDHTWHEGVQVLTEGKGRLEGHQRVGMKLELKYRFEGPQFPSSPQMTGRLAMTKLVREETAR